MMSTCLYDPVDGSSATHILRRYCDVLRIDSLAAARQYIIDARKEGSKEAYDDVRASVLGLAAPVNDYVNVDEGSSPWFVAHETLPVKFVERHGPNELLNLGRPARLVGKGGGQGDMVEKLQQFADACHDFGSVDPGPGKDMLQILERSIFGAEVEYMEPRMTRSDIADKNKFIAAVTDCDGFKFKIGGVIHVVDSNPMKDRNLEAAITPFANGAPGKRVSKVVNKEMQIVEIFFGKSGPNHKLIMMKNIDCLRTTMADFFGDPFAADRRRPKFMVDQDMSPYVRTGDPHRHLFAWMTGFGHLLVAMDEHFKGVAPLKDIGFDFVYCDATIYDGALISNLGESVTFSPEPTGIVFHKGSTVNVEFSKIGLKLGDRDAFAYAVTTTDPAKNPLDADMNSSMRRDVRNGRYREHGVRRRPDHSAFTMGGLVEDLVELDLDVASPIAQKTAGDWGQIEHCKANHITFVTCDRLTALRAASRECPVLLVKHHDYATDKYAQYSFCMFGTEEARRALTAPPMTGGTRDMSFVTNAVIVSVVLACAILGN
jgi:hypothetical protein